MQYLALFAMMALLAWSGFLRRKSGANRGSTEPIQEVHRNFQQVENSARGLTSQMEVRVYEFAREMEARMDNRLQLLETLVSEADRELFKLQRLLTEARRDAHLKETLSHRELQQRAFGLHEAGFEADEIAALLGTVTAEIRCLLDEWRDDTPGRRAA